MVKIEFDGFDQLQRDLKRMQENARKLDGLTEVSFSELFSPSFMREHTRFASIDALFAASGFKAETNEDLDAIPGKELDAFIAKNTSFSSFQEMLDEAGQQYIMDQLGF